MCGRKNGCVQETGSRKVISEASCKACAPEVNYRFFLFVFLSCVNDYGLSIYTMFCKNVSTFFLIYTILRVINEC
ncbi:MAG: hypothetical protein D6714_12085 [Bacteroidetes bacterium]|nr:MAG: hypothetical protein D6714_12085 [Bacteroidota bacterium]